MCVCVQLKQMEVQLEEEYDEKQKVLKERRELEAKLLMAQDQVISLSVHSRTDPSPDKQAQIQRCWVKNIECSKTETPLSFK